MEFDFGLQLCRVNRKRNILKTAANDFISAREIRKKLGGDGWGQGYDKKEFACKIQNKNETFFAEDEIEATAIQMR